MQEILWPALCEVEPSDTTGFSPAELKLFWRHLPYLAKFMEVGSAPDLATQVGLRDRRMKEIEDVLAATLANVRTMRTCEA